MLLAHPDEDEHLRRWARDEDLWVRRSAIICQLQHKDRTDLGLLSDVIEGNQEDPEFFIRKAIGWALRDYARTDSDWVRAFVQAHANLSRIYTLISARFKVHKQKRTADRKSDAFVQFGYQPAECG